MSLVWRPDHLLEYRGTRTLAMISETLPLRAALAFGENFGRAAHLATPSRARIALENVSKAFPDMPPREAEAIVAGVYRHFGRGVVEGFLAPRILTRENFRRYVTVHHEERLDQAVAAGRGVIFLTAHFGVWEILGLVVHMRGVQVHHVFRPMKNPLTDAYVQRRRREAGGIYVPRKNVLKKLVRVLRAKGCVAILADQHAKKSGTWVPFFGRLASTTPGPAYLALLTGATILPGYLWRAPGTYRFEADFEEPIIAVPTGDRDADIERVTAEISRRYERRIRERPEQWLWLHRRWKEVPPEIQAAWDERKAAERAPDEPDASS